MLVEEVCAGVGVCRQSVESVIQSFQSVFFESCWCLQLDQRDCRCTTRPRPHVDDSSVVCLLLLTGGATALVSGWQRPSCCFLLLLDIIITYSLRPMMGLARILPWLFQNSFLESSAVVLLVTAGRVLSGQHACNLSCQWSAPWGGVYG